MVWQLLASFKVKLGRENGIACLIGGTAKRFSTAPWRRDAGILVTIASAQKTKDTGGRHQKQRVREKVTALGVCLLPRVCGCLREPAGDLVQLVMERTTLVALLFSRQNNVRYVHAREHHPSRYASLSTETPNAGTSALREMSSLPRSLSVMHSAARVAFSSH